MATNRPKFSREQLAYLREVLTPMCCHITGMHDPRHFDDKKYVCQDQKTKAYDRTRAALGFAKAAPKHAVSLPGCGWCESGTRRKKR